MAAVFPPWSNTAMRLAIAAVAGIAVTAVAAPMIAVRTPWARGQFEAPDQPIQFDHRHHNRDDGIDCVYCHNTVRRAATAGIPSTDKCMGCHDQVWNDSPLLELVRRSYFTGEPIRWARVHRVPGFAYFNHSIHVSKGIGCTSCHGRVDTMAAVEQVKTLTMGFCLDCHREPEKHLRPLDQVTNMEWSAGDRQMELGRALAAELGIRRLTNCTTCHR